MTAACDGGIVVAGASRGLGAEIAVRLGATGARLVLVARTVGGLEETDDRIRQAGGRAALLVPLDLGDAGAIDRLAAPLLGRYGRLSLLVVTAVSPGCRSPVAHYDPEMWEQVMCVNLHARWRLLRALDPLLRAGRGRLVMTVDTAALGQRMYGGILAVSQAAMVRMAGLYAAEGNPVSLVDPGPMRTGYRAALFPGGDALSIPPPGQAADALLAALAADRLPTDGSVHVLPRTPARRKTGGDGT